MESNVNNTYNDSLCLKMKNLISEINKYLLARTEDSVLIIYKHLQVFSVTIDINIFDPDTNLGTKFFVSLYELFTNVEPQSQMSWYCVDVLSNACHNSSARRALINTYNFIPSLSRLLGDQLTSVKKKKLLKLMQDLSCGIKISWQIPHLPHLLTMLTKWVESQDEEIVSLSLGVLVNICYKNLPAVYTLSKSIDIKKFMRFCLPLRGSIIEIHVCKLMVIVDYMHTDIPKHVLIKFIEPSFLSVSEAFKNNDAILLRQIVDFFSDVIGHSKDAQILRDYKDCGVQIESLLQLVNNNVMNSSGDSGYSNKDNNNPECISLILEFIHSLMLHNVDTITNLHPKITMLAINWINCDLVSFQALIVLTKIVEKVLENKNDQVNSVILKSLIAAIPAFFLILQSTAIPSNMENCRRLGAVLQLLRGLLQLDSARANVLHSLKEECITKIFVPLQMDNINVECLPVLKSNDTKVSSTDTVDTYLYALAVVNDLAQHGVNWASFQSTLMDNRKIHMIIAQALYGSTVEVRSLALEISKHPSLPITKIATALGDLQPMFCDIKTSNCRVQNGTEMGFPMLSFAQIERLDSTLERFKKLMNEDNIANIATSQVMELYEYKLATLRYAEKSALNSVEAASEKCTHLQHRLAQITAEQNKLHHLLFHMQHCLEQTTKAHETLKELYSQEQNRAMAASGKVKMYEGMINSKDKALKEYEVEVNKFNLQIKELSETIVQLKEQVAKKEQVITKLVESGTKTENNLKKKEELLKKNELDIKNLNAQIMELEERLNISQIKLAQMTEQYQATRHIIETITKVATSSQVP